MISLGKWGSILIQENVVCIIKYVFFLYSKNYYKMLILNFVLEILEIECVFSVGILTFPKMVIKRFASEKWMQSFQTILNIATMYFNRNGN